MFTLRSASTISVLLLSVVLSTDLAFAQGANNVLALRKLEGIGRRALVPTPVYDTNVSRGRMNAQSWGRVYAEFDSAPEWLDELTVRWYVLLKSDDNKFLMLKGATTYIDIERGRGHVVDMFVRPKTLKRYGEIVGIACEFVGGGQTLGGDATSVSGSKTWFKSPNVEAKDGMLLNRGETPWAFINYDDFEVIK
jgi:hypothetical protein